MGTVIEKKEIYDTLSKSALFKGLTINDIEEILNYVRYRILRFKKNELYILEGSEHYFADIIIKGEVTSYMTGVSGKTIMMNRFKPTTFIAPAYIFSNQHNMPVTVKANESSVLLRINPEDFIHLIDTNKVVRDNYLTILSNLVVKLTQKIRQLGMKSTKEKVVEFLKMKIKESGTNEIDIIGTRQDIADLISVQRYSLVRCLDLLQKQGIIRVERKKITVLNMNSLKEMVDSIGT